MSSAVLTALLVLQVFRVYGTSLVLNGAVGESIVLPTDEEGPIRGPGVMEWRKNNVNVIRLVRKQASSSFETRETNAAFKGRLIVNYETGALNISSLREEDSGQYLFHGFGLSGPLGPKTIQLHIYERIVSVQVTSQVNNSTDGTSCHVTLSCSVIGGSQVALSWSRNGENIARAENRATLTVSPTRAEEDYTCTAINPISSLSNTVTAGPCQTGTGEALITVNGIVNDSVTLPSGSPYNSPKEVQWTIDNRIIAFYSEPSLAITDTKRFGDRLRLNTTDGSLQINRAQMGDADTYTVAVSQGKSKHNAEVKLMIYEQADTPILEVLTNTSGPRFCNVSVRCTTLHGLWVASLCQLTQGKLMCQETARNDSAHPARLLITATRDAINCSSSNPASTSSAPLLPVKQVCPAPVPDPEKNYGPTQRSQYILIAVVLIFVIFVIFVVLLIVCKKTFHEQNKNRTDSNDLQLREGKTDPNDVEMRESKTDFNEPYENNHRTDANGAQEEGPSDSNLVDDTVIHEKRGVPPEV